MSDVRLIRAYDGRCTVFVGGALVFTNLGEAQAEHLMRAFGGEATQAIAPPAAGRSVGGRSGRLATRGTTAAALASLR